MKKINSIDIIFSVLFIFLIILSLYFHFNPQSARVIQLATYQNQLDSFSMALWVILIICIIGNISPLPTPYLLIVWIVATKYGQNMIWIPLLCGLIASIGSLIGEITSYWIGRGANKVLKPDKLTQINYILSLFENRPKLIPLLIYFFGATPLSDDIILVPLGMVKYSQKKTLFFCWLGKLTLLTILAFIPDILRFTSDEYNFFSTMLPLFLITLLTYILLRIDWIQFVQRNSWIHRLLNVKAESEKTISQ